MLLRAMILPLLLLAVNASAQAQVRTLCCNDASGRRTCGDTLPPVCYDRAYSEIIGGRVVRTVEAPMTPEQRTKKDAELRVQREKLAREVTERRRDQVLLDSYASVSELDRRRDRDIGNLESEIRASRAREADLMALNAKLEKQIPAKGNIPRTLADNIATNKGELEAIRLVMASKQREMEQMRARFDADRQRYIELNGGTGTPP